MHAHNLFNLYQVLHTFFFFFLLFIIILYHICPFYIVVICLFKDEHYNKLYDHMLDNVNDIW